MTNFIEERFPDVPDKCINCPGLETAVNSGDFYFGLAANGALRGDNSHNPIGDPEGGDRPKSTVTDALTESFTEIAEDHHRKVSEAAAELSENCPGVIEFAGPRKWLRKPEEYKMCGSLATAAAFIPPQKK